MRASIGVVVSLAMMVPIVHTNAGQPVHEIEIVCGIGHRRMKAAIVSTAPAQTGR